ncbi:hypothetical protein M970_020140 [Encephalitozoon cuniculi EcunIII-L]|uniref:Uncharacterized protein n=1 Tax=Encephalitozoon cuniculi TaxID=6035 RepID=M1K3X4_ENCCN|nr:hypothetical protein ECU02_0210 [Encephalitozoon cuniculi]KMV66540.1 hypothetical protein M970_020140 [Encephalitozoon cuniculi EcunIII-L]UYI28207.1 hypothetical protein J0A71_10g21090 [Encephalitozoon cuniculi]
MEEDGPRLAKMRQAYKRAIQEILKEQEKIKEILVDPNISAEDSFFVSSPKAGEICQEPERDPETISKTVEDIFQNLRSRLSEAFKKKLETHDVENKLNQLDRDVLEGRTSLRDVTSEEYIKEIFESYLVDTKVGYINYVEETKMEALKRIKALKCELEKATKEVEHLKKENALYDGNYNNIIGNLSETVRNRHNL